MLGVNKWYSEKDSCVKRILAQWNIVLTTIAFGIRRLDTKSIK